MVGGTSGFYFSIFCFVNFGNFSHFWEFFLEFTQIQSIYFYFYFLNISYFPIFVFIHCKFEEKFQIYINVVKGI